MCCRLFVQAPMANLVQGMLAMEDKQPYKPGADIYTT
jgi:hypothetical protein